MLKSALEIAEVCMPLLAVIPLYLSTLPLRKTLTWAKSGKPYPQPMDMGRGN